MRKYFYSKGNQQYGPFSLEELKTKEIQADSKIRIDGENNWIPASKFEELKGFLKPPHALSEVQYTDLRIKNNFTGNKEVVSVERWKEIQKLYGEDTYSIIAYYDENGHRIHNDSSVEEGEKPPPSYLVESILVTLFCCLPFGIAGIVNASKVETLYYSGDIEGAKQASKRASKWNNYGIWFGIAFAVLSIAVQFFIIGFSY